MYKCLCGHTFSFLLGMYLGVELLGNVLILHLINGGTVRLFSEAATPLHMTIFGYLLNGQLESLKL